MPTYKLIYFSSRARAELIRLLFAQAGVKFENKIVRDDKEFEQLKADGVLPFNQLPVLEVDGKILCQSKSIMRFVADQVGLAPKSSLDRARADQVVDGVADVYTKFLEFAFFEKDEDKKANLKKVFFATYLPVQLGYFEKLLRSNREGKGYFVGNKLTYADLAFFNFCNCNLVGGRPETPIELKKFSLLEGNYKRVLNEPNILHWIKTREDVPL